MCAMPEIIGLSPLRGSSVYRPWNPGPRGTGLTIWCRSAAASFPRFGHRASRLRKWIYFSGHSLPGRCTKRERSSGVNRGECSSAMSLARSDWAHAEAR